MATEFRLTYKYTGQTNVHNNMVVTKGNFTLSGDTTKRIGKITKIEYVHTHTSTEGRTWNLYGRLKFGDATYIDSDTVSKHISGDVVTYKNTFTENLPTPSKFNTWASIQTIAANPSSSVDIYWRATADEPMYIYVYFIEAGFMRYGVDGAWKECEVFFGVDGAWKQVTPHFGVDGVWKST